jgi:putative oxygen-independent coproporphyrinogen III oxidase
LKSETPPLGVYIHWPYCARICPYCDFNVVRDRGRKAEQADLVEAIAADLTAQAAFIGPRRLVSIFFGGGTPSLMDPDAAGRLIERAKSLWPAEPDLEVTLEANPTDAETGRFDAFAAAGVDRLSLGVQALDDASLAFLGRNHDAATARRAVAAAAQAFPRLSLDLIYALPGQTEADWTAALDRAVDLGAEHLSPYQLTIEAGTAFGRAVQRGQLPVFDPELGARLFEATQARLEGFGFEAYEVSNHARGEAARSRHNLVYWRGQDYVGVGPGAHGRLTLGPEKRLATEADKRIGDYVARVRDTGFGWAVREELGPVAIAEERLLNGLRTVEGVAWADLEALTLSPSHPRVLALEALQLIRQDTERLRATAEGRLVLDRLVVELAV